MSKLAYWILKLLGWNCQGEVPELDKCIVIVAPHTSNWDFVLGILTKVAMDLKLSYFGKASLFNWYSAWFFRFFGGIPVKRNTKENIVSQAVNSFSKTNRMWLALSPEGTRSLKDYWRSGFYHIAIKAQVPLLLVYIDAPSRTIGLGPVVELTGDIDKDMDKLALFYKDKIGICPEKTTPVRIKHPT